MKPLLLLPVLLTCGLAPLWGQPRSSSRISKKPNRRRASGSSASPTRTPRSTSRPIIRFEASSACNCITTSPATGQYLAIAIPVKKIQAPIHKLRFMLYGDKSGCGYGMHLSDVSDETHKFRNAADDEDRLQRLEGNRHRPGRPPRDLGRRQERQDRLSHHRKLLHRNQPSPARRPSKATCSSIPSASTPRRARKRLWAARSPSSRRSTAPTCRATRRVTLAAPGFKSVTAKCWKQGGQFGSVPPSPRSLSMPRATASSSSPPMPTRTARSR